MYVIHNNIKILGLCVFIFLMKLRRDPSASLGMMWKNSQKVYKVRKVES